MTWVGLPEQDQTNSVRVVAQFGDTGGYLASCSGLGGHTGRPRPRRGRYQDRRRFASFTALEITSGQQPGVTACFSPEKRDVTRGSPADVSLSEWL